MGDSANHGEYQYQDSNSPDQSLHSVWFDQRSARAGDPASHAPGYTSGDAADHSRHTAGYTSGDAAGSTGSDAGSRSTGMADISHYPGNGSYRSYLDDNEAPESLVPPQE